MTLWTLLLRSLRFHARSHLGALLGAAVGSAVLVGALVVGDSVRGSLRDMALRRLGGIHFAINTQDRLFQQNLAERLPDNVLRGGLPVYATTPRLVASMEGNRPAAGLLLPGLVSRQDGAARANRVNVIGVEPGAWQQLAGWSRIARYSDWVTNVISTSTGQYVVVHQRVDAQPHIEQQLLVQWLAGEAALLNESLARQLRVREGDELILRVRKPSALPLDTVITPRDEIAVALRLKVGRVLSPELLADFSLAASQIPPPNIFLPLDFLAQKVGVPGQANLLLHGRLLAKLHFSRFDIWCMKLEQRVQKWLPRGLILGRSHLETATTPEALARLTDELRTSWSLEDAELMVRVIEQPQTATRGEYLQPSVEVTSARIFLEEPIVKAGLTPRTRLVTDHRAISGDTTNDVAFSGLVTNGVGVLTYLVNLIQAGDRRTPYSMVTAADSPYVPADLRDEEILVNEWLADDLQVRPGDTVHLSYYLADSGSKLVERTNAFRVRAVVPMKGHYADRTLMPEFPGLAKAESTHDWNAGFPLVHKIREKDEDYWKKYRGTSKAFITLSAGQKMWANRFGSLTAIRYEVPTNSFTGTVREAVYRNVLANLDPAAVGLRFEPVREQALAAVNQSQDFGGLFLGFSFFLIVAALLLMALLFQFGIEQRTTEVGTFLALGFTPRQVRRMLLFEGGALALIGGVVGAFGGVWYARGMLHGLSTIWREAVGTSALSFHAKPLTLLVGALAGIVVAWVTIWLAVRKQAQQPARELLAQGAEERGGRSEEGGSRGALSKWVAAIAGVLAVALVAWAVARGETAAAGAFFGAGALLLVAGLALAASLLTSLSGVEAGAALTVRTMGTRNCARRRKRSLATVGLLACGSFLVAAVGANRLDAQRDATQRSSGTGGFALLGETTLPIVHDLNTAAGREFFGLESNTVAGVSFVPFRVREGDDASCLNLNRAQKPRLLGVRPELLAERGAFTFAKVAKDLPKENPWMLLNRGGDEDVVHAIGDAASIQWAMGKKIGDTITYADERGREFKVKLVAAVANSVLQGNLLIDEAEFVRRFPSESGYRMFLIDCPSNTADQVAATLSRAMQDVGLELTPTVRQLAAFNAVQNTYLNTFQLLGGLGLLLGSVGLGVVVLRNVLERRSELALLLAVGFRLRSVKWLVVSEHGALLVAGLTVGVIAAVVAVLPALLSPGAHVPYASLGVTLAAVFLSGALWTWLAARWALRGKLIEALRSE